MLVLPENAEILSGLISSPNFQTLTAYATVLDERSRGIKKLVSDGLGEFMAKDLYLNAGKTKSKCIKVVSLIYCMFNLTKVLIVEPNLETRLKRMQDVTAAMKTKEQPLPFDVVEKFKEMQATTWKPVAPTTSPSKEQVAKGAGGSSSASSSSAWPAVGAAGSSSSSAPPASKGTSAPLSCQSPKRRRRSEPSQDG